MTKRHCPRKSYRRQTFAGEGGRGRGSVVAGLSGSLGSAATWQKGEGKRREGGVFFVFLKNGFPAPGKDPERKDEGSEGSEGAKVEGGRKETKKERSAWDLLLRHVKNPRKFTLLSFLPTSLPSYPRHLHHFLTQQCCPPLNPPPPRSSGATTTWPSPRTAATSCRT